VIPQVSLLRLQPSTSCNLNCTYCYIPADVRRRRRRMDHEVLRTTLARLVDEDLLDGRLTISWHGAEPLTAGVAWYEEATAIIGEMLPGIEVSQVFQTNGVLIDDEWCRHFGATGAMVGVSIDGPAGSNPGRVNWAGRSAHDTIVRGIERLNAAGIPWTMLAVVTEEVMGDPAGFVEFVHATRCRRLGFKVEETNVANRSRLVVSATAARYRRFVQHLWHAFPPDGPVVVREFDRYRALAADDGQQVRPATLVPLRNLTVSWSGDFTVFSGELLFQDGDEFVFGNVFRDRLLDSLTTERFRRMSDSVLAGVRRCAATCEHYRVCGSFFLSQKHAEHGTFDAAETLACELEVKTMFRALDDVSVGGRV
jgi:uncharacterized protein